MSGLKANPGGNISPDQTIGRDQLCRDCLSALDIQSIRLENERRLGKTTVIHKMVATAPKGTRTIVMEIGGLSSTIGFIEELIREIDNEIPEKGNSFKSRVQSLIGAIAGME